MRVMRRGGGFDVVRTRGFWSWLLGRGPVVESWPTYGKAKCRAAMLWDR
jgi:hypothetical protein